jgi:hypothetical protein
MANRWPNSATHETSRWAYATLVLFVRQITLPNALYQHSYRLVVYSLAAFRHSHLCVIQLHQRLWQVTRTALQSSTYSTNPMILGFFPDEFTIPTNTVGS